MSRRELDIDEPSVDALQSLLLLVVAFTAAGKGKKAYMAMSMSRYHLFFSPCRMASSDGVLNSKRGRNGDSPRNPPRDRCPRENNPG